jgi:putative ABC transport system substrate-binding protein
LSQEGPHAQWRAFFAELERLGFTEGHNFEVERYSGEGRSDSYAELAQHIVSRNPDVIFAMTTRVVQNLAKVTNTIPIVGVTSDPVVAGLVSSLSRPGGNVTGVTDPGYEIWGKRFEILRELLPNATRFGLLHPKAFFQTGLADHLQQTAQRAGVILINAALGNPIDRMEFTRAFAALADERVDALLVGAAAEHLSPISNRRLIIELAAKGKIPTLYPWREFVIDGGLIGHVADLVDKYRHAAHQVSEILRGANVGDIPFNQESTYKLLLNLNTAKELGLRIPPALLARADEVIE